jgi:hypothetical protein
MTPNESSGDAPLGYDWPDNTLTVQLPARQRTKLVDVVEVILSKAK